MEDFNEQVFEETPELIDGLLPETMPVLSESGTIEIWKVNSVNGQQGDVVLTAADVGAPSLSQFNNEITNRKNADSELGNKINSEATSRKNADTQISQNLYTEINDRQTADNNLSNAIVAEASNRRVAISNEAEDRQAADNILHQEIVTESNRRARNDTRINAALQEEAETRGIEDATILAELENEAEEREAADQEISNTINAVTYMSDLTMSATASSVTFTEHKKNIGTGQTTTEDDTIPTASSSQAGILTASGYQSIVDSQQQLEALKNGAVAVSGLSADPTQAQLTAAWENATGLTMLINRASIWDETNQKTWTYFTNTEQWTLTGTIAGQVTINQATNTSLGIVKGEANTDGKISIESDGSQSVNGWSSLTTSVANKADSSTVQALSGTVQSNTEAIGTLQTTVAGKADTSAIPTTTSELNNDSDFVSDSNYVHTDNNYTTAEKNKLGDMPTITAVVDALNSTSATNPLSANQGKALNDKFSDYSTTSEMNTAIETAVTNALGDIETALEAI